MQEFIFRIKDTELRDLVEGCWERGLEETRDVTRCVARKLFPAMTLELPPPALSPYLYAYKALEMRVRTSLKDAT